MDTTLWPYRLKTARQKKRLKRKHRDKQLLNLERQSKELQHQKQTQPTVILETPYQRGWMRKFVLKADTQKGKQAEFYQQILDVINEVQYHYDASFKQPKRKGKGSWHRYYFDRLPQLQAIKSCNWLANKDKLGDGQRALFEPVRYWDDVRYRWDYYCRFTQPELFEIAVLPHIVYEVRVPDGELESRLAFVDDSLYGATNRYRHIKIKGGGRRNCYSRPDFEKKKYEHPFKNKPLHEIFYRNFFGN